jgi:cell pole-organizing protein PopZ
MSDAKTQQEPSMEEILASIRRIISEDAEGGQKPAGSPEAAAPAPEPAADDDVLELTDRVNDDGSVESVPGLDDFPDLDGGAKPSFGGGDEREISFDQDEFSQALMSGASSSAAATAFAQLEQEMSVPPRPSAGGGSSAAPSFGGGLTVEQLVIEALRPMLKDWLDQNLPGIVEDLVRGEIERVAQAGRRR